MINITLNKYIIAPMRLGPYGIFAKTDKERHKDMTLFMQINGV